MTYPSKKLTKSKTTENRNSNSICTFKTCANIRCSTSGMETATFTNRHTFISVDIHRVPIAASTNLFGNLLKPMFYACPLNSFLSQTFLKIVARTTTVRRDNLIIRHSFCYKFFLSEFKAINEIIC